MDLSFFILSYMSLPFYKLKLWKQFNNKASACWLHGLRSSSSSSSISTSSSFHSALTQLLQRGNAKLVVVVVGQRRRALPHDLRCDGIGRHLHRFHAADQSLEALVGERRLTPVQLYDPKRNWGRGQRARQTNRRLSFFFKWEDLVHSAANLLVQVIERVGDANCHLHSSLWGQFLNGCIALLPEGLRVVLVRQTGNVPLLETVRHNKTRRR